MEENLKNSVILLALILTVATGCASNSKLEKPKVTKPAEPEPIKMRIELTDKQINAAKNAVLEKLKDPESARFSGIYGVSNDSLQSGYAVCGFVNSKNSYGGYAGKTPFSVSNNTAIILSNGKFSGIERSVIKDFCTSNTAAQ